MIRTIIVDDEPLARNIVKEYLQDHVQFEVMEECSDGFEGVKAIMQYQPELVFLDIQMPKINGFEMLELIEQPPSVIFTTAFDEYAIRAFEAHAVDYLLKPFSKERFDKALQKWLTQRTGNTGTSFVPALLEESAQTPLQHSRIVVKTNGKIKIIPVHEVQYLEAADDYVKNKPINFFEKMVEPRRFCPTHHSYIENIKEIPRLEPYEKDSYIAVLHTGLKVPVSKAGYLKLKQVLGL